VHFGVFQGRIDLTDWRQVQQKMKKKFRLIYIFRYQCDDIGSSQVAQKIYDFSCHF